MEKTTLITEYVKRYCLRWKIYQRANKYVCAPTRLLLAQQQTHARVIANETRSFILSCKWESRIEFSHIQSRLCPWNRFVRLSRLHYRLQFIIYTFAKMRLNYYCCCRCSVPWCCTLNIYRLFIQHKHVFVSHCSNLCAIMCHFVVCCLTRVCACSSRWLISWHMDISSSFHGTDASSATKRTTKWVCPVFVASVWCGAQLAISHLISRMNGVI